MAFVLSFDIAPEDRRSPISSPVPASPTSAVPWIVAALAGVIAAALAVVYFVVIPDIDVTPAGGLSSEEQTAVAAAGTDAANLVTYSRAHYERDYARALSGATGAVASDLKKNKALTLQKLTEEKFDISATVRHTALVGRATAKIPTYVVLVVLFGYQSTQPALPNPQNLQVTVEKIGNSWKASAVQSVGAS